MSFLPGVAGFSPLGQLPPIVKATNTGSSGTSASTSYSAPLPANIVVGELLLLLVSAGAGSVRTVSTPSGWTQLFNDIGGRNVRRFCCFYKTASGSEGASVSVSASAGAAWASNSYRIARWRGTPEAGTTNTGTSTDPIAPTNTPSWGVANTLYIAAAARDNAQGGGDFTAAPTNYEFLIQGNAGPVDTNYQAVGSARLKIFATAKGPGSFTSTSAGWAANTIAVRPF